MKEKIIIIPKPKKIIFKGQWLKFDGIRNIPAFFRKEFSIRDGSFTIEQAKRNGSGVEVADRKIKIWGNTFTCYSTVCQLLMQRKGFIPEVVIEENFNFSFRGYHLDIPRGGVPTLEKYKHILKLMFLAKYTHFAIYFEDLFPWNKYPQIGAQRGRMERAELREIIRYGRELGIEVFPSLELTGHMKNMLVMPEFSKFAESSTHFVPLNDCLNLSDPEARQFAYDLLEEALDFFGDSEYIHIGGDETAQLSRGKTLNKTLKYVAPQMYEMHHKNLISIVRRNGKKPIMWGDMLAGAQMSGKETGVWSKLLKSSLWDKALIANWDYNDRKVEYFEGLIRQFGKREQVVCPGFANWSTWYPSFDHAFANTGNFFSAAMNNGVKGFLTTSWGDDGAESMYSFVDPLIIATAELAQNNKNWKEQWMLASGEPETAVALRSKMGFVLPPAWGVTPKHVLFSGKKLENNRYKAWKELIAESRKPSIPPDLKMMGKFIELAVKKTYGTLKTKDIYDFLRIYRSQWLSERKEANLQAVLNKFNPIALIPHVSLCGLFYLSLDIFGAIW